MNMLLHDYTFYQKYHRHPINKFIHIWCIPMITWGLFILINQLTFIESRSIMCQPSTLLYTFYISYYLYNDLYYGMIAGLFYMCILLHANVFFLNIPNAWFYACVANVFGWVLQILSHRYIEKNKPALVDGLKQSILTAPLFIIIEIVETCSHSRRYLSNIH